MTTYRKILYSRWHGICARCRRARSHGYTSYGGRGIAIDWPDFDSFYTWAIQAGFRPEFVIDRIDPDKNYGPDNCQFITSKENLDKQKTDRPSKTNKLNPDLVRFIHAHPEMSSSDLAQKLGTNRRTIWNVRSGATWAEFHPEIDKNLLLPGTPCRKRISWNRTKKAPKQPISYPYKNFFCEDFILPGPIRVVFSNDTYLFMASDICILLGYPKSVVRNIEYIIEKVSPRFAYRILLCRANLSTLPTWFFNFEGVSYLVSNACSKHKVQAQKFFNEFCLMCKSLLP